MKKADKISVRHDDGVRSVGRAIDIIFACASAHQGLDVQVLQEITELPRATLYRLLSTLENKGMIYSYGDPKRFQLGDRIGTLTQAWKDNPAILELAREAMGDLWRGVQETVGLFVPVSPTHRLCVAELKSPHVLSFSRGTGYLELLHRGASGKVLLAFASPNGPAKNLREIVGNETHEPLLRELADIRKRGYSVTRAEINVATMSVAAPILDNQQVATASICAFAPQMHMSGPALDRCIKSVREAAQSITAKFQENGGLK